MALQGGPYYSSALESAKVPSLTGDNDAQYPDLDPSNAPSAHIYSLADGALQIHRNSSDRQLAGLIQAATAAAGQEISYADNHDAARRTTRQSGVNHSGELLRLGFQELILLQQWFAEAAKQGHYRLSTTLRAVPLKAPPFLHASENVTARLLGPSKLPYLFRPKQRPLMNPTLIKSEVQCKRRNRPQRSSAVRQLRAKSTPDLPCRSCLRRLN